MFYEYKINHGYNPFQFVNFNDFKKPIPAHQIVYPRDPIIKIFEKNDKYFECKQCQEQFNTHGKFTNHIRKTHWTFRCKQCDMSCKDEQMLTRHIECKHVIHKCEKCKRIFSSKKTMKVHIKRYQGQEEHTKKKCKQGVKSVVYRCHCGKIFKKKRYMVNHQRAIHDGIKPYKCMECGKKFTNNANFRRHRRTHTGNKKFECTICKKRFTRFDGMRSHMRVHNEVKQFKCNHCGMEFRFRTNMIRHVTNIH